MKYKNELYEMNKAGFERGNKQDTQALGIYFKNIECVD